MCAVEQARASYNKPIKIGKRQKLKEKEEKYLKEFEAKDDFDSRLFRDALLAKIAKRDKQREQREARKNPQTKFPLSQLQEKMDSLIEKAKTAKGDDLDFITDEIKLSTLYESLKDKAEKFNKEEHKTIFDLDKNQSVLDNLELLISFDNITASSKFPTHTHDNIKIFEGSKTWIEARISWRSKVRALYDHLGIDFPKAKGIDIS
jgi:hypothetical protein